MTNGSSCHPVRITSIEILRGLAASAVCFFHFICGNKDYFPDGSWIDNIGKHGFLGVEVFFVLSGALLHESPAPSLLCQVVG